MRRTRMRFCARLVLVCLGCLFWTVRETGKSASAVDQFTRAEGDAHKLLKRAQQLSFLHNWSAAGLLFQQAEELFEHKGDERDRLYSRIGRIRGLVETGSLPDASDELAEILKSSLARNDLELRLFCLTAKGDIDFQINPQSSRQVWEAVSKLAASLGNAIWENRARAELGTLAFYNGEIFRAMHLVGRAYLEAERQNDLAEIIRNLAALGEGFAEFGHYEDALRFFEKAMQQARTTPGAEIPFTAYLGKAQMLIKLDRSSAGKKMLEAGLNDACARHMQVREARIRLVLGDLARSEGKVFEAITHLQKAAEIAKTQQLYRMLGAADSKLALLYAERENADAAIASALAGAQAARQGSDIYHLPQLLTVLAEQKITRADFRSAEVIYQKALSLIDELLVNVPTFQDKSVLVGTMSSVYRSYFEFTANQLRDPKKAFQVLEQARGRGTADFLRSVSSEGRDATFRSGISDANELVQNSLRPIHIGLRFEDNPTKREELQWSLWEKEKRGIIAGERDQWPGLAHARPVSLSAFQATLNSNELVLEFSLGEPQSTVLEIERESISAHRIAGGERLKTLVESYRADVWQAARVGTSRESFITYCWLRSSPNGLGIGCSLFPTAVCNSYLSRRC
jgi:tetratricopeptide (TPR) repeat protein